ncbi:class I SAM-dependent methyltransferase [Streptomyces sp. NBC_01369]|uniref:class I SAM-dependent methyltransferase n=1 Tax=Streptomyces sp. NBC_01369 TaxID=2903842 RepID=UPI00386F6E35
MDWLRDLLRTNGGGCTPVHRVLDIGSGPGVVTCLLAHTFPDAEVVAVDQSPGVLERVRSRAVAQGIGGRVVTRLRKSPGEFGSPDSADLIWIRNGFHRIGDPGSGIALRGRLPAARRARCRRGKRAAPAFSAP